jgi:hypothetical protein
MLALASEEKFFSFHRISSILILPQIGTILLLTLLQIYLLLSHRLQVKIMEETVKNLKKTDQIWGLKGLILCSSVPVWGTRMILCHLQHCHVGKIRRRDPPCLQRPQRHRFRLQRPHPRLCARHLASRRPHIPL